MPKPPTLQRRRNRASSSDAVGRGGIAAPRLSSGGPSVKHRTFFWFILPSLAAMTLFIALPIVSVFTQSLFVEPEQVIVTTENCGPFGCEKATSVDVEATQKLRDEQPLGRFNGLGTYLDRSHLAVAELGAAWTASTGWSDFLDQAMNLPFYRALAFTLTYTFLVTPLVILFGLLIALFGRLILLAWEAAREVGSAGWVALGLLAALLLDALTRASFTGFPTAYLSLLIVGVCLATAREARVERSRAASATG